MCHVLVNLCWDLVQSFSLSRSQLPSIVVRPHTRLVGSVIKCARRWRFNTGGRHQKQNTNHLWLVRTVAITVIIRNDFWAYARRNTHKQQLRFTLGIIICAAGYAGVRCLSLCRVANTVVWPNTGSNIYFKLCSHLFLVPVLRCVCTVQCGRDVCANAMRVCAAAHSGDTAIKWLNSMFGYALYCMPGMCASLPTYRQNSQPPFKGSIIGSQLLHRYRQTYL